MTVRSPDDDRPFLPVDAYRDLILSRIRPLPPVCVPLEEAWGCVLAENAPAPADLPRFASSGMDGYAVRAVDVVASTRTNPAVLRLVGEVRMGRIFDDGVAPGEAVAISTGGALPSGTDAVVPVEWSCVEDGDLLVSERVEEGAYVRPAGQDVYAGQILVEAGTSLAAPDLGLLASAGLADVLVHPRPLVGVLSTGDELVRPGTALYVAQIYDANAFTLIGAVRDVGAVPVDAGIAGDDPEALRAALDRFAPRVDVFVCSGGVSMGQRDPVKRGLAGEVEVYEVAMQPGKPQAFGEWKGKPFFGLPGNAVSVFVSFEVFVRPALERMMGRTRTLRLTSVVLEVDLEGLPRKTRFVKVHVRRHGEQLCASPVGGHGSNLVGALARGDGLLVVPAGAHPRAGDDCRVMLFRDGEV